MQPNPKDFEVLSNSLLDGDMEMSQLPREVQDAMMAYWQTSAGGDPSQPVGQDELSNLVAQREQQRGAGVGSLPFFMKPIEALGSGLYWLYSETVSPALSTVALGLHRAIYGKEAEDQISTNFWGLEDAKDLWSDAHKVSPGQAIWQLGFNNDELRKRGISPNQMAADKDLVAKGKYRDTPTKNDPFGTIPAYQEYFGKGASKYITGTTDFAVSWYMDPLVIGGNWASKGAEKGFTKPVAKQLAKQKGAAPEQRFEQFSQTSTFQSMVDMVGTIKANNPDNAAFVLRQNMPTVAKSANGDVFARLLVQAKNDDEVADVLRITMGDDLARTTLGVRDVLLATQVDALSAKQVVHQQYFAGLSPAKQASPYGQRVQAALLQQEQAIAKMEAERGIISDKLNAFGIVENLNYNRFTTPLTTAAKGKDLGRYGDVPTGLQGGGAVKASARLVYNSTIGFPIKVVRSYGDIKPSYYIDIHGETSYKEVEAALKEYKGISREDREAMVSRYIKATPNERQRVLNQIENESVRKMIDDYNAKNGTQIDRAMADELYADFVQRRTGTQAAAAKRQSYGSATMADPANPALTIRVAEIEADGGRLVSTPIFDTQLANNHVLMDFKTMERAINAHGQTWDKTRKALGKGWATADGVADQLSTVWKFAQLARLGYAPRALADDFLGQVARFGGLAMAGRTASGAKTMVEDLVRGKFMKNSTEQVRRQVDMLGTQISDVSRVQASLKAEIARVQAGKAQGDLTQLKADLDDINSDLAEWQTAHADLTKAAALGSQMRDVKVGRQVFAGAFAGQEGQLFADLAAGQRNFANMMGGSSDWYLKKMRRLNWENITPASAGPEKHLEAWERHVVDQIGQSSIGRKALEGYSEADLVRWMRTTPEGKTYRKDIGLKNISDYELAQRVKAQVDHVLDPNMPGMYELRNAILKGDRKQVREGLDQIPQANRPEVNAEMFSYAEGRSAVAQLLDSSISGFYHVMNQLPQTHLLRNPLFGQQYKANLKNIMETLKAQGVTHVDESLRKTLESNARKAALQDVKNYTFTMDHETKMAFHMRNFGAFFGAQQESWNRWARIIADKPQTLPHIAQAYGAPARAGLVVDVDGNTVDAAGYSTDPVTGEKKLTKYGERRILIQVPEYLGGKKLNKALGLDEDASFVVPMSSLEIVMNHGDGYLPVGTGPFVQMSVNHFAQDDPNWADWSKKMGILPFGPQDSWTDFVNPNTGKRLGDATDDMSETKQRMLFYSMQSENWKYQNGFRDTEPTWDELLDRADRWTLWRTGLAFGLPFSLNAQDPYQFFRDEFSRMQKLDPNSADEKFYEKYGDSFYLFSQSMSKNNTGLKPTVESVQMSQYYKDLIDKVGPEYAGLIVGDEGDGEFSNGAYFYQKTHGLAAGSTETQRTQLSAREAWDKAQVSQGWQDYNSLMSSANAQLFDGGFKSFKDPGAEDLLLYKKAVVYMLTKDKLPDGTDNPYYNESWEREFNSMDKGKYDRNAAKLYEVVEDPELWSKAVNPDGTVGIRSDIYTLRTYLENRRQMQKALMVRDANGGSADITAKQNEDLKDSWDGFVMKLIEADTRFSWVHSRWFATDMGFNIDTQEQSEVPTNPGGALTGQQPGMLDVMEMNANGAI